MFSWYQKRSTLVRISENQPPCHGVEKMSFAKMLTPMKKMKKKKVCMKRMSNCRWLQGHRKWCSIFVTPNCSTQHTLNAHHTCTHTLACSAKNGNSSIDFNFILSSHESVSYVAVLCCDSFCFHLRERRYINSLVINKRASTKSRETNKSE